MLNVIKVLPIILLMTFSFAQGSCTNNCGEGTLQEYWAGTADCVCNMDCAGYGSACCDFYNVCFENPNYLQFSDFVGTWEGNITNDQTWAFDYPITIVIEANGNYSVPYNPGQKLVSDLYPGTEEFSYNSNTNILTFKWVSYYHYACGGACYTGVYFQVMEYNNGMMTLFYNNGSGPAPQAYTMNLSREGGMTYESGDINQDGAINVSDVVLSVNIILGISPYNELADLNGDGIVNILDVIDIVNIVLGNSSS
jgi:hypothetical protein